MTDKTASPAQPTPIVAIGVGNRMRKYLTYVEQHPDRAKLVAIVEPDAIRRRETAIRFSLPEEACFDDYDKYFASSIKAEAVIICTPENNHFDPTMKALEAGCHVLLEKPAAQTAQDEEAIKTKAEEKGKEVCICHVLRYHPCFMKVKELVDSGKYGKIVSITHTEDVGLDRMGHSYVRGTMNREKENNPLLLAKCCHDIDFLLWISGQECKKVSSFGSRLWFREENAPVGSAERCIDCSIERTCPYSAIDLYWRRREWVANFDIPEGETLSNVLQAEFKYGRFGRCVYHCDNDVVDNQVVTMLMADGSLITLHIDIFTQRDGRTTDIKMTGGEIVSDGSVIRATHFASRECATFDYSALNDKPFHGGADLVLVEQFLNSVRGDLEPRASTTISEAIKVQKICTEADESRRRGEVREL